MSLWILWLIYFGWLGAHSYGDTSEVFTSDRVDKEANIQELMQMYADANANFGIHLHNFKNIIEPGHMAGFFVILRS